jgi:abequosyltransferase
LKLLAICIPTFNRASYLGALLESIVEQTEELSAWSSVCVVVADNASQDRTGELVARFQGGRLDLHSHRHDSNTGFAANMNFVVEAAQAQYCWLMGSDDLLCPGALEQVLSAIRRAPQPDLVLGNKTTRRGEHRFLPIDSTEHDFTISDESSLMALVASCQEISALFAYISTLVVRRDAWLGIHPPLLELSHAYTHCLRLFRLLRERGGLVRYLNLSLVTTGAAGNEYASSGYRHMLLDAETLEYLASQFIHRNAARAAFLTVFKRQYGINDVRLARVLAPSDEWTRVVPILQLAGYRDAVIRKSWFDALFRKAFLLARSAKHFARSLSHARN